MYAWLRHGSLMILVIFMFFHALSSYIVKLDLRQAQFNNYGINCFILD